MVDLFSPTRDLPTIGHFGPYDIVGRLAMGGMAEILLAKEPISDGQSRFVVIKRVLPQLEGEASFIAMFEQEARIGARLNHPNLCHIYDFGQISGQHYIAMEWVNGVSFGKFIRHARDKAGGVPVAVACRVVSTVAEALHYAHHANGDDGQPLGLVHRDVSPHNVMIGFEGGIKLLDFGIAKARTAVQHTQAGVVKGKFSYMSPEQIQGTRIDHRSDIFALGIVLYEAITMRPLYLRETEPAIMLAITQEPVPRLSDVVPMIPAGLDAIVSRALAKDPADRFQTAAEMAQALEQYLASQQEWMGTSRIAEFMDRWFAEEIRRGPMVETRPFGSSYHEGRETVRPPDIGVLERSSGAREIEGARTAAVGVELDGDPRHQPGMIPRRVVPPIVQRQREAAGVSSTARLTIAAGLALGLALAGAIVYGVFIHETDEVAQPSLPHSGETAPRPPPPTSALDGVEPGSVGQLTLSTSPSGTKLFIGGQYVGVTPVERVDVRAGVLQIELELPGGERVQRSVFVAAGGETRTYVDLSSSP